MTNMAYDKFITLEDFASYWGTTADCMPEEISQYLAWYKYQVS